MGTPWRMPAEWENHTATWIAWPHQRDDWPGKFEPIPWVYASIVRHLTASERVRILVKDEEGERDARAHLQRANVDGHNVDFTTIPTDRVWTRDTAGTFVVDAEGRRALLDWRFEGWAKYGNWQHDDAVPPQVARLAGVPTLQPQAKGRRVALEGGAIEVNGAGLLLTTEECLLSTDVQPRNPHLTRADYEAVFAEHLGVRKALWLGRGLHGDDTHGHIDDLARFVAPNVVVTVVEDDPGDVNHEPLRENVERLRAMTDLDGRPLEVHTLPLPAPVLFAGQRLPASYANFYIANDRVLVPTFDDPNDRHALNKLAGFFPERTIVGIHALDLVWGLGTLHCLTQQEPEGKAALNH